MSSSKPIGFFDSGIGGVTVLREAVQLLPNEDYIFFSDSKNNPYGDKSDGEIIARCAEITRFLTKEKQCKAVVIACNTASAKAARSLRALFGNIPIVAIEPAYKVVHDEKPDGRTLIMATRGTVKSEKFRRLYYAYYNHRTLLHACPGLADLIEQGDKGKTEEYLKKSLAPYKSRVQNVVLGCTHYPLAKKEIAAVLGDVNFYDGAGGVARRLKYLLEQGNMLNSSTEHGRIKFMDSNPDENIRELKESRFFEILER